MGNIQQLVELKTYFFMGTIKRSRRPLSISTSQRIGYYVLQYINTVRCA